MEKFRTIIDQLDWDDVRVFLALWRSDSLRATADALGLSHPTVRRHLDSLETGMGLILFERSTAGLQPTQQGQELYLAALAVEEAMEGVARTARGASDSLRGPIKVSMALDMAMLLADDLTRFTEQWSEIELTIETGNAFVDLDRLEADVVLRSMGIGARPTDHIIGRKVPVDCCVAAYGDADTKRWITMFGGEAGSRWAAQSPFPDWPVQAAVPDAVARAAAARAGMGVAMLPPFLAEGMPRLSEPVGAFNVWVLTHPDLRRNPRLRAFRDAMVEAIHRHGPLLRGEGLSRV